MFLSQKYSIVSHYSSIGTLVHFPLTMFQLDDGTFAIMKTQPSNMQGEHWRTIAEFVYEMYFADYLGRKKYRFLKQEYKQMMPAQKQSHPCLGFLHDSCHFASFQVLSGRSYCNSKFYCARFYK